MEPGRIKMLAEQRPYSMISPRLGQTGNPLPNEVATKCLSYIIKNISKISDAPEDCVYEVIKAKYLGPAWAAIGYYDPTGVRSWKELGRLSFRIESQIATYVDNAGLDWLIGVSEDESLTWQDIEDRFPELNES